MEGYFNKNTGPGYNPEIKSTLNINVANISEFNDLLVQAKKEAHQLNETIDKLHNFQLNIEFSTGKTI